MSKKSIIVFFISSFLLVAYSFIYIHLIINRTNLLKTLKELENLRKEILVSHSEYKNKYIQVTDLNFIENKAKKDLKMVNPKEVLYLFYDDKFDQGVKHV